MKDMEFNFVDLAEEVDQKCVDVINAYSHN